METGIQNGMAQPQLRLWRRRPRTRSGQTGKDQQLFSLLSELELFDFHDSRPRNQIQSGLIRNRLFRTFQLVGRTSMPPSLRSVSKRASHQAWFRQNPVWQMWTSGTRDSK